MVKTNDKLTIPESSEELAEMIADDKVRPQIFADADTTSEFLAAYTKASNQVGQVAELVTEQVNAQLTETLKEHGVDRPNMVAKTFETNPVYNPKALGAKIDELFDGPGDYLNAIWHKNLQTGRIDSRMAKLQNYSEQVPDAGGFLVPETLRSEILRVGLETSIVRSRARIIPMDSLRVPIPAIDSTSNASSVYGGIIVYWTPESGTIATNDAKFGRVVLEAKKLTGGCVVPNELMNDSINSFATVINTLLPEAMGHAEDYAFIAGTGVGEPQGFLNSPAVVAVAKEGAQVASTVVWQNIVNMYARMLPGSLNRGVWLASPDVFPQLATMALAVGAGGSAVWLNNGTVGPPATILGRPLIITEKVPALGTQGQLTFVDCGFYLVGDRQLMTAASSEHIKFDTDETMFRVVNRVDGRGWIQSAITPKNSSAALSPFVVLAA